MTKESLPQLQEYAPITVVIPYHSNTHGLAVTLTLLQAQVLPPTRIVVIDTSKERSGLEITRRYFAKIMPIVIEHKQCHIYEAWNLGIELAKEDTDILFINDDLLFPLNMIDVMNTVSHVVHGALCITAETPPRDHYSSVVQTVKPLDFYSATPNRGSLEISRWMPGFFFMLTKKALKEVGNFDEQFKVWFGDTDMETRLHKMAMETEEKVFPIVKIKNMFVYHFGGSSYKYGEDSELKKRILRDRELYMKKYKMGEQPKHSNGVKGKAVEAVTKKESKMLQKRLHKSKRQNKLTKRPKRLKVARKVNAKKKNRDSRRKS